MEQSWEIEKRLTEHLREALCLEGVTGRRSILMVVFKGLGEGVQQVRNTLGEGG